MMNSLPTPTTRECFFSIDRSHRRFKKLPDAERLCEDSITEIRTRLISAGFHVENVSGTTLSVKMDSVDEPDDWTVINQMQQRFVKDDMPIKVSTRTVGGQVTEPYHPDILKVVQKHPDYEKLGIDEKIALLHQEGMIK